jgi:hypothetical protein
MAMGKVFDDQEDEVDELEADAEESDAEELEAEADTETETETPVEAGSSGGARDETPEERTVASRQKLREQMAQEIEEFLARGGKISQIEPNVTADPPRKPDTDYGSRPI